MLLIEILQLCALALITTLLLYFTGNLFINIVSRTSLKTPRNFFFSIFWGAIIIISLAAIIVTKASSIFLLTIIPVLIIAKHKIKIEEITWRRLFWQMLSVTIIYGGVTLFLLYFPYTSNVENDIPFYSKISQHLFTLGKENSYHYFNEVMINTVGNTPYHYFELYFNGLVARMVSPHFTHMFLLKFLTLPLFITYIIIGLQNFIIYNKNKASGFLSLLFVVFVLFINFDPIPNIFEPSWSVSHFIFTRSIFIFYVLVLTAAFSAFRKTQNYYLLTAYLLLLPIISATTTPAVYSGTILLYIYLLITKEITRNTFFKLSALTVGSAVFFFIFYLITGTKSNGVVPAVELQTLIDIIFSLWKAIIHQIVTLSLRTILFALLPALLIYIINKKSSINLYPLLVFSLVTSFAGVIVFQLIPTIDNAYQIPYIGYSAIATLLVIALILLYNYMNNYIKISLFLIAGVFAVFSNIHRKTEIDFKQNITYNYMIHRGYKVETIKAMESILNKNSNTTIKAGFIFKETTQARDLTKPAVFQHGNDFNMFNDRLNLYPLTPLERIESKTETDLSSNSRVAQLKEQMPFYKNYTDHNDLEYINQYITDNNISFLIVEEPIHGVDIPTVVIPVVN